MGKLLDLFSIVEMQGYMGLGEMMCLEQPGALFSPTHFSPRFLICSPYNLSVRVGSLNHHLWQSSFVGENCG